VYHNKQAYSGDDAKLFILMPRRTKIQHKGFIVKRVSRRMWIIDDNNKPIKLPTLLKRFE